MANMQYLRPYPGKYTERKIPYWEVFVGGIDSYRKSIKTAYQRVRPEDNAVSGFQIHRHGVLAGAEKGVAERRPITGFCLCVFF